MSFDKPLQKIWYLQRGVGGEHLIYTRNLSGDTQFEVSIHFFLSLGAWDKNLSQSEPLDIEIVHWKPFRARYSIVGFSCTFWGNSGLILNSETGKSYPISFDALLQKI